MRQAGFKAGLFPSEEKGVGRQVAYTVTQVGVIVADRLYRLHVGTEIRIKFACTVAVVFFE
jgi:hypothetical protein